MSERDRRLAAALGPLGDALPSPDWGDVLRRRDGGRTRSAGPPATVVMDASEQRHRTWPIGVAAAALLAVAVVLAGLQGIRSQPASHRTGTAVRPAGPIRFADAFSKLAAQPPVTDPVVKSLATDIGEKVIRRLGAHPIVHELPSDARVPLYVAVGDDDRHLALFGGPGRSFGIAGTTAAAAADPEWPGLMLVRAPDDGIVAVELVADDVRAVRVLTAEGSWVDLEIRANVASARVDAQPARVLTTLRDGTTVRWDQDLALAAGQLPPSRTAPYAGDIERQFAAAHPDVIARVGPAVVRADGSVGIPAAVARRIEQLRTPLLACLADHRIPVGPLGETSFPRDPYGRKARACPTETAAADAYALSLDLVAAGALRELTTFAINPCLAKAKSDLAARHACVEQFAGRLPPFPDWAHPASSRRHGPTAAAG
jgi:hypothetical protein